MEALRAGLIIALLLALSGCTAEPLPDPAPLPTASSTPRPSPTPDIPEPVDGGAYFGANGPVVIEDGVIVQYTVVPGDIPIEIAHRFGLGLDNLENADGVKLGRYPNIYPDDVITFGTSLSGDEYDCFFGVGDPGENPCLDTRGSN